MDPISIVSVLDLAAKFENLHRLLHEGGGEGKLNNNFSAELASRLDLWSTDVCGESRAHDETPSHVLRVIEDADPGSSLVKALHDDFDQLQSIVDKSKTGANLTEESTSDWHESLDRMYHLSDSVRSIRREYAAATDPKGHRQSVILTFDGGGIRSYSSILIMQELMHKVAELQHKKTYPEPVNIQQQSSMPPNRTEVLPRDFFDYIFGTSSGGLLAIMLGRLQMPLSACQSAFQRYSLQLFDHPRLLSTLSLLGPRYSKGVVTKAIKELVEEKQLDPSRPWKQNVFASEGDPCRTGVVSWRLGTKIESESLHLFRSYDNIGGKDAHEMVKPGLAAAEPIWAIARATCAAPTYFPPMEMNGYRYLDGGVGGYNNPSILALSEVMEMERLKGRKGERELKDRSESPQETCNAVDTAQPPKPLLISIGTGYRNKVPRFSGSGNFNISSAYRLVRYAVWSITDTSEQHMRAQYLCELGKTKYHRFNVERGLEHITLDDNRSISFLDRLLGRKTERTLKEIEAITKEYLYNPVVQEKLEDAAKDLIAAHRTRIPPPIEPLPDLLISADPLETTLHEGLK